MINSQIAYPIVLYAQKIGKNTADLTTIDMVNYTKWWIKQPQRKDLMEGTETQRKVYNKDVQAMNQYREEQNMAKKHTTVSFQAAQTSRLAEQGIESPINDGEEEIVVHEDSEVVCSMDLTRIDVTALLWGLKRLSEDYELNKDDGYGASLLSLKEGLEGV